MPKSKSAHPNPSAPAQRRVPVADEDVRRIHDSLAALPFATGLLVQAVSWQDDPDSGAPRPVLNVNLLADCLERYVGRLNDVREKLRAVESQRRALRGFLDGAVDFMYLR